MAAKPKTKTTRTAQNVKTADREAKDRLFVEAYCTNGGNGAQAYMDVFKSTNPDSAATLASRLLRKVKVSNAVAERRAAMLAEAEAKTSIRAAEVIASAARVVKFDLRLLYPELTEDAAFALELAGGKLKLDRTTAREQLMKHFGLFKRDNEQTADEWTKSANKFMEQIHASGTRIVKLDFDKVKARVRAATK